MPKCVTAIAHPYLSLLFVLAVFPVWVEAENRLADETSPYLRLHAHNPVDWYPWGPEALAKAKQENKVIFLSVGYSSCYWCHVMERESFMDEEIAKFLNENFVCIKVDREERPDLDSIYMLAVQIASGGGGWPMSVFLTPSAKPFFGGTYFPARDGDRGSKVGFLSLIKQIHTVWGTKQKDLEQLADRLTGDVRRNLGGEATVPGKLQQATLDAVRTNLVREFDPQYGGFGFEPANPSRPKFPEPSNLLFLLDLARQGDAKATEMVNKSLEMMHSGGIWDHIGGGFHRYSVDRFWRIPHFEKMLYDNGQLVVVYTQAFELTKRAQYRRVVERTLDWALREMRDSQGGFYSALDAESEKVEGKFYRWELDEVKAALGDNYQLYAKTYRLDEPPNFEDHFHVPQLSKSLASHAEEAKTTEAKLWGQISPLHQRLLTVRDQRPRPLTDTKILASWNGLMIRGLADAGRVFERESYVQAASEAAQFIWNNMRTPDGRLYRTHTAGEAKLNAYLDDYAFLCDGLIGLHKATQDIAWLRRAEALTRVQIELFADEAGGGFFFTSSDHEALIARGKQPSDGAQPAGNSVSAQNLIYLAKQLDKPEYLERARSTVAAAVPLMQRSPRIAPRMAIALSELLEQ